MKLSYGVMALALLIATSATAAPVTVTVKGTVEYNQVRVGDWRNTVVTPGSPAEITFLLDSDVFVNSVNFPVRAYPIDQASFSITLGPAPGALRNPFPAGTPAFVIRNNDPAVDGFYFSTAVDGPNGLQTNVAANTAGTRFFESAFEVSYTQTTLSSLNILDALGVYDFTGIGSFYFVMLDLGFEPIGMIFETLTISGPVPVESTSWSGLKALYR